MPTLWGVCITGTVKKTKHLLQCLTYGRCRIKASHHFHHEFISIVNSHQPPETEKHMGKLHSLRDRQCWKRQVLGPMFQTGKLRPRVATSEWQGQDSTLGLLVASLLQPGGQFFFHSPFALCARICPSRRPSCRRPAGWLTLAALFSPATLAGTYPNKCKESPLWRCSCCVPVQM